MSFRSIVSDYGITKPIIIGNDVYIGNDIKILSGSVIVNRVIIGAGAVVSGKVPDNPTVVGVSAKK